MSYPWSKSVFPIAAIFSFRMLGLFMLIPIFTLYAPNLLGATPALTGIALGSYGLSQGLLQMPFGILSDKYGRKKIITIGLVLFALGSLLGATTDSMVGMIAARILQGMGAIGSVLIALLADLTPDSQRTKAMAVIGGAIGISFSLAMLISPVLAESFGMSAIFYFAVVLALIGLVLLHLVIPTPNLVELPASGRGPLIQKSLLKTVLANKTLLSLNAGIFFQHLILTSTFYLIPLLLEDQLKLGHLSSSWHFYLPMMLLSFLLMVPIMVYSEKKGKNSAVFLVSVLGISLSQGLLIFLYSNWIVFCLLLGLYFVAFNFLEASLPSMVSKTAKAHTKGTAMGVYSSCQFLGIFAGGLLSGFLFEYVEYFFSQCGSGIGLGDACGEDSQIRLGYGICVCTSALLPILSFPRRRETIQKCGTCSKF
jgi:MFS family permease